MTTAAELEIQGEKVVLRPFTVRDITDDYLGWLNDPLVTRFSNQRFNRHDRPTATRYLASFEGTPNMFVSVRRRDNDTPVGTMNAYISTPHGTADVGIMIGNRTVWGKGYGLDAWNAFTGWLLSQPGIRKVTAGTLAINEAMVGLATRSGMTLEGRRLRQEIVEGQEVDILYFGKFKNA